MQEVFTATPASPNSIPVTHLKPVQIIVRQQEEGVMPGRKYRLGGATSLNTRQRKCLEGRAGDKWSLRLLRTAGWIYIVSPCPVDLYCSELLSSPTLNLC